MNSCLKEYLNSEQNRRKFEDFAENKFGFGSWNSKIWFIGPEEGGGNSCTELAERIDKWPVDKHGKCNDVIDLKQYCKDLGDDRWHRPKPKRPSRQSTWCRLVSFVPMDFVTTAGQRTSWEKEGLALELGFQRDCLGQDTERNAIALFDISPLANPRMREWKWESVTQTRVKNADSFHSRVKFLGCSDEPHSPTFAERRLERISKRLDEKKPHLVLFYGGSSPSQLCTPIKKVFGFREAPHRSKISSEDPRGDTLLMWIHHPRAYRNSETKGIFASVREKIQKHFDSIRC